MSISLTSLNNPSEKTDCHLCGHGGTQKTSAKTLSFEDRGMQNVMCFRHSRIRSSMGSNRQEKEQIVIMHLSLFWASHKSANLPHFEARTKNLHNLMKIALSQVKSEVLKVGNLNQNQMSQFSFYVSYSKFLSLAIASETKSHHRTLLKMT